MSRGFEMLAREAALDAFCHHFHELHDVWCVFADRCILSIFAPSFVGHDIGASAEQALRAAAHGRIDPLMTWSPLAPLLPTNAAFPVPIRGHAKRSAATVFVVLKYFGSHANRSRSRLTRLFGTLHIRIQPVNQIHAGPAHSCLEICAQPCGNLPIAGHAV
jgi:hypothetical protein